MKPKSWEDVIKAVKEGRGVLLSGIYGDIVKPERRAIGAHPEASDPLNCDCEHEPGLADCSVCGFSAEQLGPLQ